MQDITPYINSLRRYFVRKTGNMNIVDDLVQDVMTRVLARRAENPIENIEAYLFRTAANVMRDKVRRDTVRQVEFQQSLTEAEHPVDECTPDRVILAREEVRHLIDILAELPETTRDIFLMKRFDGLSHAEISARIGMSVSGIEKRIAKAVAHIARRMPS
ncbi:MAG: sigma-70 family RNA polymerase sigma factor [Sphingobium sp.]|nr:sigma-70 family RNA polymerase sigma factor [Sphingobium sp.]